MVIIMIDRYKSGFIGAPVDSNPGSSPGLKSVNDQFVDNLNYSLPTNIPRNNLRLYLDYSSRASYLGYGNGVRDLSGNNNNCRMGSNGTFINYRGGIIRASSGLPLTLTTPITNTGCNNTTIVKWYKWGGTNTVGGSLYLGDSGSNGYGFYVNDGSNTGTAGNRVCVLYGGVAFNALGGLANFAMTYGQWVCLILTRDTTTTSLYANGTLVGTTTSTPAGNASTLSLTSTGSVAGDYGLFAFYNRAFTQADVTAFYNGTRARFNAPVRFSNKDIVTTNLILNIDSADPNCYSEKVRNTVYDISGNGREATLNAFTTAPIVYNSYPAFNGNTAYMSIPDVNAWTLSDFTIDVWFYRTGAWSTSWWADALVAHDQGSGSLPKWIFTYNVSKTKPYFHINTPSIELEPTSTFTVPNSQWTNFTITRSGSTFTFYANGTSLGTTTNATAISNAAAPLTIGTGEGASGYFNGRIGDVRIYTSALTGAQVTQNYNASLPKYAGPTASIDYGIVTTNLTLNLDAADPNSLRPGYNHWNDISGNGYIVPFPNGMNNQDPGSGYIDFNSTNIYGSMTQTSTFNFNTIGGDFTLAAWVYPKGNKALNTIMAVWSQAVGSGGDNWDLYTNASGQLCFVWASFSVNNNMITGNTVSLNSWSYITITRVGNVFTPYINGVAGGTVTHSGTASSTYNLDIGRYGAPETTSYYNGRIAAVHIYKGLGLNQAQVTTNFNAMKSRFGL